MKSLHKSPRRGGLCLVLLVLMALLAPASVMGQVSTLTVNDDGTMQNYYVPVNGSSCNNYLKCEMLYPSSQLTAMNGAEITSLKFYAYQTINANWGDASFIVYLAEVTATGLTYSYFVGPATGVVAYQGSLSVSNSEMTIELSTPYTYHGGNLLVSVYNAVKGSGYSIQWWGASTDHIASAYASSNSSLSSMTQPTTIYYYLPKTTFEYAFQNQNCLRPKGLNAPSIGTRNATVSWTAGTTDQDAWELYYTTNANEIPDANTTGYIEGISETSYNLTNLTPETTYYVYVRSNCGTDDGKSIWSRRCAFTTEISCYKPTSLTLTSKTATSATFTWESEVGNYDLSYSTTPGEPDFGTIVQNISENTYTIENLSGLNPYYVYVRAKCDVDDYSKWSDACVFQAPVVVDADHPYSYSFDGPDCEWAFVNGDMVNAWYQGSTSSGSYSVENGLYISKDGGESNAYDNTQPATVYAFKTLTLEARQYEFQFQWRNKGESSNNQNAALRVALVPDAIQLQAGEAYPSTSNWIFVDGGPLRYQTSWQTKTQVAPVSTAGDYKLVALWANQVYSYQCTPPAAIDEFSVNVFYPAPYYYDFTFTDITKNAATISNYQVDGAESYDLYWSSDSNDVPDSNTVPMATTTETSFRITELSPETTYYVYVRAYYGNDHYSLWSYSKNFTTAVSCPAPYGLFSSDVTAHTAQLNWYPNGEETAWQIQIRHNENEGNVTETIDVNIDDVTITNGNMVSYQITGLKGDTYYYAKVRANCGEGDDSDWTYEEDFRTGTSCWPMEDYHVTMKVTAATAQIAWVSENGESRWHFICYHYDDISGRVDVYDNDNLNTSFVSLSNLTRGTSYYYEISSYCGVEDGWSSPTEGSFTTMDCNENELSTITYDLNKPMQWGDWRIRVDEVWEDDGYTNHNTVAYIAPHGLSVSGGVLNLCLGKTYSFYAYNPNYGKGTEKGDEDKGRDAMDLFVFYEYNGDEMFSLESWQYGYYEYGYPLLDSYLMNNSECNKPKNLTVNATMTDATVIWEQGGSETSWKVNYRASDDKSYDFEDGLFPEGWYDYYGYSLGDDNIVEIDGNHCLSTGDYNSKYPAIPISEFTGELSFYIKNINYSEYWFYIYLIERNGDYREMDYGRTTDEFVKYTIHLDEWAGYHGVGVYFALYDMMLDNVVIPGFEPWNPENEETVTNAEWNLSGLTSDNTYQVGVRSVCSGEDVSGLVTTTFTTPLCDDGCSISYELADSYGDGWNGAQLLVIDENENEVALLTISEGATSAGSLSLCAGTYWFVWSTGECDEECSYTFYGPDGGVAFHGNGAFSEPFVYVLNCDVSCFVPKDLDVAAGMTSATVTWTPGGEESEWMVQYDVLNGNATIVDFEDLEEVPETWEWYISDNTESSYSIETETDNTYLQLTITESTYENSPYAGFEIPVVLGGDYSFQAKAIGNESVTIAYGWYSNDSGDDYSAEVGTGYQTFTISSEGYSGNGGFWFEIDEIGSVAIDNVSISELNPDWSNEAITVNNTPAYTITGLEPSTAYKVRVKAVCGQDDESNWAETSFTTLPADTKTFTNGAGDGMWNTLGNWNSGVLPTEEETVLINAAATISNDCKAYAGRIIIGANGSLTIEDGGMLYHANEGVVATVKKTISAYDPNATTTDGWYLIASPLAANVAPANVTNMVTSPEENYDLFMFNQFATGSEWQNFKQNHPDFTTLEPKVGYLYANAGNNGQAVTLQFNGVIKPIPVEDLEVIGEDDVVALYKGYGTYASWNLVGNPHVCAVYPIYGGFDSSDDYVYWWDGGDAPFYRMNPDTHADLIAVELGSIMPGEGVFIQNNSYGTQYVRFSTEPNEGSIGGGEMPLDKGGLTLNLTKDCSAAIDRAIVRFGEGPTLGKLMLNPDNTNICIPQGTEDYAIVRSACEGEVPVNFKAAKNGNYTLKVNVNDAEMEYLHLVDNLTGADVDLLESPAYTFDAKTTDYASRFKLVFKAMEDGPSTGSGTFAYYNGSTWTVSNLGEATLQVIDAMGRILSSETIHGNAEANIQAAPGVYMLRLVNGNSVKTQKVVVR